jgi:hypothetical protein
MGTKVCVTAEEAGNVWLMLQRGVPREIARPADENVGLGEDACEFVHRL